MFVGELIRVMRTQQKYKIVSHWLGCEYQLDNDTIKAEIKEIYVENDTLVVSIDY